MVIYPAITIIFRAMRGLLTLTSLSIDTSMFWGLTTILSCLFNFFPSLHYTLPYSSYSAVYTPPHLHTLMDQIAYSIHHNILFVKCVPPQQIPSQRDWRWVRVSGYLTSSVFGFPFVIIATNWRVAYT